MDQESQQEIQLLKKLINTLQSQNNSRNLERTALNNTIDRLVAQNSNLYHQNEALKHRLQLQSSAAPIIAPPAPPAPPANLHLLQSQSKQLLRLQHQLNQLGHENTQLKATHLDRQTRLQMEKTLMHREMEVLKKLATQNDGMVKRNEVLEEGVRKRDLRIRELEQELTKKAEEIQQVREDVGELKHKAEVLSEELGRARIEDAQGQLVKYEKEVVLSRKAYEELQNSTNMKIDLLEHKLFMVTSELQNNAQQKSHSLVQREQLGRTISQLRQMNQSLTLQLQTLTKQYDELLKLSQQSHNALSNSKQSQQIQTLRQELSSMIAINFTLSNQLNAARERQTRPRKKSDVDSSRGITERFHKDSAVMREDSPVYDSRANRFSIGGEEKEGFGNSRVRERTDTGTGGDRNFDKEFKKLRLELNSIKTQNDKMNFRNRQLSQMNEFLVKKNATLQLHTQSKPHTPSHHIDNTQFYFRQRHTSKDYTVRPSQRLSKIVSQQDECRSSRHASNKSKLIKLQKKLNELKLEDLPKVSPRVRNNL